jgi:hypothetical protein
MVASIDLAVGAIDQLQLRAAVVPQPHLVARDANFRKTPGRGNDPTIALSIIGSTRNAGSW